MKIKKKKSTLYFTVTSFDRYLIYADIDECSPNPCSNGGICKDGINGYTCTCAAGYKGNNCEIGCFSLLY